MLNKRKKRRLINLFILLLCVAILGCSAIGIKMRMNVSTTQASAENSVNQSPKPLKLSGEKVEKKETLPDRTSLAVTPGVPVGTLTQTTEKVVYLTLDDGPSPNTQAVLDILDTYNIKATFFVTNAMPEYAGLIKVAHDKGHTIGLHTSSHDYASVYSSVDAYFQDLDAIGQTVQAQIGYVPCFIRFPGGSSNSISTSYSSGIMSTLAQEVQRRGYQYYDWNASSGDGSVRNAEQLVGQATSCNETNVVLLSHDSASKQTTVEALLRIIEHYLAQGYVFKALDRDSFSPHHGILN